ncbi:MAG: hypothetical protein LBC53_10355 [Spirochaetaceae bacterium]|jgi:hypothetical protein|nr:hypothetical protein [Spirochaetaceae bacterium]
MANKNRFWKMFAAVLVFGMVLLGCPNDTTGEKYDVWSNVTDLNQLNGTWKGSYSQTQTIKEMIVALGETWEEGMSTTFGDMKVTTLTEITTTIKSADKTQSFSFKITMTFSGGNIDTAWTMIKEGFNSESYTIDDSKHSITTQYGHDLPIKDEDIAKMLKGFQINQNGTKMKIPADDMSEGSPEVVMIKQ